MRTNLQDEYEQNWDPTFVINFMNDESIFHNNGTIVFLFDKTISQLLMIIVKVMANGKRLVNNNNNKH